MAVERLTRPALLIVDMQNDFVRVGAPLEVPQARDTIAVHRALIAFCRERAIPILYTKFVAGPERTLIWAWSRVRAPPGCCCWTGQRRHYAESGERLGCGGMIRGSCPATAHRTDEKFGC